MRLDCRGWGWFGSRCRFIVASTFLGGIALLILLAPGIGRSRTADARSARPNFLTADPTASAHSSQHVMAAYGQLPLMFEPNQGQSHSRVKFLARGNGYGLFLTAGEAVLSLQHSAVGGDASQAASVVRMAVVGGSAHASITGADELPGKSNYFIGNVPSRWHRDIPQFARVRYRGVYPGIDLVYHGNQGRIEYDFEVSPGRDPKQIALKFQGPKKLKLDNNGDLLLDLAGDALRLQKPQVYQTFGTTKRVISGAYKIRGSHEVGFQLGAYDRSRTLVIDPVLTYSTYLGGSGNEACSVITGTGRGVPSCPAIAVDLSDSAYIAGSTTSTDFPIPVGGSPYQSTLKGKANIFIAKFDPTGTTLEYATYLGGNGTDIAAGDAVDAGANVYVAGTTSSTNFPTKGTNAPFQATALSSGQHVFVSKLDPAGHTLLYSTYLSGTGTDIGSGVAIDPSGNTYVTGTTTSKEVATGFPSTVGSFQTKPATGSAIQFFMTELDPNFSGSSSMVYSTYFGGGNPSNGRAIGGGIAVQSNTNVYITGGTNFLHVGGANDFPILNAYQGCLDSAPSVTTCPTNVTALDAFVAAFDPYAATVGGAQLLYSTYLGGSADDVGYGIAVDSSLNTYVTGSTASTDFVLPGGAQTFQVTYGGGPSDAFLGMFGTVCTGTNCVTTGVPLDYFTYLGGSGTDVGLAITVDANQGARITGYTNSTNFPVVNNPVQLSPGGGFDAFVARIDTTAVASGAPGNYATYLGGSGNDFGTGIAVDTQGSSYVAGETSSTNFLSAAPPQNPSFQSALNGSTDAFASKLGPILDLSVGAIGSPTPVGVGNQVSFAYTITNNGDYTNNIIFTDTLAASGQASFVSATASPGNCGAANGGTVACNIGSLNSTATATVTVVVTPSVAGILGNNGTVNVTGTNYSAIPNPAPSVEVNDFNIAAAPASITVPAGTPASYTVTLTPTGNIPNSISVNCGSGLPTGATCTATTNPFPNLSNGPASTVLVIGTTARVTTTTRLWRNPSLYAAWLPLGGLTLLGVGMGGKGSRRRRLLMALVLVGFFSLILFQAGCSSTASTTTVTGTPAGTYIVTVNATSGTATHSTTVTLVVQ